MAYPANIAFSFGSVTSGLTSQLDQNFTNLQIGLNGLGNGSSVISSAAITTASITSANVTTASITTMSSGNVVITGGTAILNSANITTMSSSNVVITGGTAILSTANITTAGISTINFGDGTTQTTAPSTTVQPGFVNRIRNASLSAQQYGTSGAIDPGAPKFTVDGFVVGCSGANVTWQVFTAANAGVSSPSYALRITGSNGVTDTFVRFPIAGEDSTILSKKTVTFQVGVAGSSNLNVTPTLTIKHPSALDNWANVAIDVNSVNLQTITSGAGAGITLAYAFTANSSVTNGIEAIVDFGGALGNSSTFIHIWSPDMRVTPGVAGGQVATPQPAEIRNAESDIAWCQRFLASSYQNGTAPGVSVAYGVGGSVTVASSTAGPIFIPFPVPMHTTPSSISYWDTSGNPNKVSSLALATTSSFSANLTAAASPGSISQNGFVFVGANIAGSSFINYTADVTIIGG